MKLSEIAIQRPVFATVMSLAIVLLGYISFTRLPVREYPETDPPIVSVTTLYRGASPNVVETEITDVLEEQFSTIESVKTITSSSREQGSVITIEFELHRDVDESANDVRDRVSRIRGQLPREAEDPIVAKVDVNAQPIMWLALSSENHSGLELSDYADRILKERLQRLPGVGSIFLGGERRYAMRIWLDPLRMAARGITVQDVEQAVRSENAEIPGGRVEGNEREFAVRTRGDLNTPEGFGAIIVLRRGDEIVRLDEIAEVEVGPEDERTKARFNGNPTVGLGIVKQKQASTLDVAKSVRGSLPELGQLLPEGMRIDLAFDSSAFIQDSVDEVGKTILIALCLVVLVVFVFLKSLRATVIPVVAIPISIIGSFTVAFAMGFTINILTLLALVLSIGLVVDDAIVVLENVYRHLEMGKSRRRAAFDGTQEIGFAVIATTVALVAVFIPVAFLTGAVGRLFREFGITLAVAVAISSFVALTLTPVLCSRILQPQGDRPPPALDRALLRRLLQVAGRHLCRHPALVAALQAAGLRRRTAAGGDQRLAVRAPARGAGADRGSRHRLRHRDGARGGDPRIHRPLHAADRGRAAAAARAARPVHRHRPGLRRPRPRDQRLRVPEPHAQGRARAQPAAAGGPDVPAPAGHPRRAGLPDQPAQPGLRASARRTCSTCCRPTATRSWARPWAR